MPRAAGLSVAYGIGAIGYAIGLLLSALFDLPTGAVVVWALAGVATLWSFFPGRR